MIERRALRANAFVGKRLEEGDDCGFIVRAEAGALQVGINIHGGEIAAAAVEVHNLIQSGLAAVDEVRPGEFNVAQARSFYRSAHRDRRTGGNGGSGKLAHGSKLRRGE